MHGGSRLGALFATLEGHVRNAGYLFSQVASSVTNAVVVLAIAGASSGADFGRFSLVLLVYSIFLALLGSSFGSLCGLREDLRTSSVEARRAVLGGLWIFALPISVVGLAAGFVLGGLLGSSLVVLSLGLPLLMSHELLRWFGFGSDHPWIAVAVDLGWLVVVLPVVSLVSLTGAQILAVWVSAGSLVVVIALVVLGVWPSLTGGRAFLRVEQHRLTKLSGDAGVGTVSVNLITMGVGAVVGFAGLGALRGAQTLVGPLAAVARSLASATLGRSARQAKTDLSGIYESGRRMRWAGVGVAFVAAIASLFVPAGLGEILLGDSWGQARLLLPPLLVAVGGTFYGITPVNVLFCVTGGLQRMLVVRTRTAIVSVPVVVGAAFLFDAPGAAAALAFVSWLGAVWFEREAQRLVTMPSPGPVRIGIPPKESSGSVR